MGYGLWAMGYGFLVMAAAGALMVNGVLGQ